jgi:hypothetical protein
LSFSFFRIQERLEKMRKNQDRRLQRKKGERLEGKTETTVGHEARLDYAPDVADPIVMDGRGDAAIAAKSVI